ncbi:DUF222 domain-containing protein [Georgenia sp. MJ173]|uniref:HNH endonuclease signature motif containing protein n=1 Tax=Georgenia sunbinii TaxID=3117728 RepID=UPI002F26533A
MTTETLLDDEVSAAERWLASALAARPDGAGSRPRAFASPEPTQVGEGYDTWLPWETFSLAHGAKTRYRLVGEGDRGATVAASGRRPARTVAADLPRDAETVSIDDASVAVTPEGASAAVTPGGASAALPAEGDSAAGSPDIGSAAVSTDLLGELSVMLASVSSLAGADWHGLPGRGASEALDLVEQVERQLAGVRSRVLTAVDADGLWTLDGSRTFNAWVRQRTGATAGAASRQVRESRALRDHLPLAAQALAAGLISAEHVSVLVREAVTTQRLRAQLVDPVMGEAFLVDQAQVMDAGTFTKVVKAWAIRVDPEAADRRWREDDAKEKFTVAPTTDGFHVEGWLDDVSGTAVRAALAAHMGRKAKGDDRPAAQRRAAALVSLARQSLDGGLQGAGARVRPHVTVTTSLETLRAMAAATGSAVPPTPMPTTTAPTPTPDAPDGSGEPAGPGEPGSCVEISAESTLSAPGGPRDAQTPSGRPRDAGSPAGGQRGPNSSAGSDGSTAPENPAGPDNPADLDGAAGAVLFELSPQARTRVEQWQPGDDHVISTAIDYDAIRGMEPATLEDGTPLSPALLARLVCESALSRVVFGPQSTVLDVGREQRIFPANQARAIHARDRHCQYPGCDEPPGFGEIHHSLWWGRDHGPTDTEHGILLCWHHHDWVHAHQITIARTNGTWIFHDRHGQQIQAPRHNDHHGSSGDRRHGSDRRSGSNGSGSGNGDDAGHSGDEPGHSP